MILIYIILLIPLAISVWNLIWLKYRKLPYKSKNYVVIIPARNEQLKIEKVLQDLTTQTLRPLKVIVVDDNSTDETNKIVHNFCANYSWISIIKAPPLPQDWVGKSWACWQGWKFVEHDNFDKIVFLDADIRLEKHTLSKLVQNDKKVVTVFPSQRYQNTDILLTPMVNWLVVSFLPIQLAEQLKYPSLSAANGQCLIFDKIFYQQIEGHSAVKYLLVEDMGLVRLAKRNQVYPIIFVASGVSCQMYSNIKEAMQGLSKNSFPGTGLNPVVFLLINSIVCWCFLQPNFWFIIIIQRLIVTNISKQTWWEIVLHPLQIVGLWLVDIYSLYLSFRKKIIWKDRVYKT